MDASSSIAAYLCAVEKLVNPEQDDEFLQGQSAIKCLNRAVRCKELVKNGFSRMEKTASLCRDLKTELNRDDDLDKAVLLFNKVVGDFYQESLNGVDKLESFQRNLGNQWAEKIQAHVKAAIRLFEDIEMFCNDLMALQSLVGTVNSKIQGCAMSCGVGSVEVDERSALSRALYLNSACLEVFAKVLAGEGSKAEVFSRNVSDTVTGRGAREKSPGWVMRIKRASDDLKKEWQVVSKGVDRFLAASGKLDQLRRVISDYAAVPLDAEPNLQILFNESRLAVEDAVESHKGLREKIQSTNPFPYSNFLEYLSEKTAGDLLSKISSAEQKCNVLSAAKESLLEELTGDLEQSLESLKRLEEFVAGRALIQGLIVFLGSGCVLAFLGLDRPALCTIVVSVLFYGYVFFSKKGQIDLSPESSDTSDKQIESWISDTFGNEIMIIPLIVCCFQWVFSPVYGFAKVFFGFKDGLVGATLPNGGWPWIVFIVKGPSGMLCSYSLCRLVYNILIKEKAALALATMKDELSRCRERLDRLNAV